MLVAYAVAALSLASVAAAAGITGCSCAGYAYTYWDENFVSTRYEVLYHRNNDKTPTPNNEGWCFKDGALIPEHQQRIVDAMVSNQETDYVNATWAFFQCSQVEQASPGTVSDKGGCANYILDFFPSYLLGDNRDSTQYVAPCSNYPVDHFTPLDCNCDAFRCDAGYTQCGASSCIDPATQACVSDAPVSLRRRRHPRSAPVCPRGAELCPTRWGAGFECLDTSSHIEACGGCPGSEAAVDCTALPGVADVACAGGKCAVRRCDRHHELIDNECLPYA